jgi:hypothetical protein
MINNHEKNVSPFSKFVASLFKAMFTRTDKADFMRLKNFIC